MSNSNSIENYNISPTVRTNGNSFKNLFDISAFQLANVIDIILDESHPFFPKNNNPENSKSPQYVSPFNLIPHNYKGDPVESSDIDYTYIGRIKIRVLGENQQVPADELSWAIPLDNSITHYPLINELVLVLKIGNLYYYTKPLNRYNYLGTNPDFMIEVSNSSDGNILTPYNANKFKKSYIRHPLFSTKDDIGFLGNSFVINPNIRHVKPSEGDTIIESRFGQSIRFSAYDTAFDSNTPVNSSYKVSPKLSQSKNGGYGNPKIVIRNRQRNLKQDIDLLPLHPKLPAIPKIKSGTDGITDPEKNYGGFIEEDINYDGSTIEIISGDIQSKWKSTVYKSIFSIKSEDFSNIVGGEEQIKYSPSGSTTFKFPSVLNGDQIIINSDRLIFSSRLGEIFQFSKKRHSIVTDSEYTVDANDQIILTTNQLTCINSPQIFLGQYGETNEPALLGQTTVDWLYDLCDWLLDHVHWYDHVHPHPHTHVDAGEIIVSGNQQIYEYSGLNTENSNPNKTQLPVQQEQLKLLRDNLHSLMSRRVYLTGGGYALGSNGVKPKNSGGDCIDPIKINTFTGQGVLGDFKGKNRRESRTSTEFTSQ